MIKNNMNYLAVMLFSSLLVGVYQLPLIENTFNKYGYENNINGTFTFSREAQQIVEDQKISFSSMLNDLQQSTNKSNTVFVKEPVLAAINMQTTNTAINATTLNTKSLTSNSVNNSNLVDNNSIVPVSKNSKCAENCVVLMIGDSVMGDVDFSLQRLVKKQFPTWKVVDGHKVSSGLTNQTYYDWPSTARKLVEKYQPDYVFVLLGTNDAQGMMYNGKALPFNKEPWITEYANRVKKIKEIIETNKSNWYWIGLPVTRDKGFNGRLQVIRNIQSEYTKENYIQVESIFGKNDHSEPLNMKLRSPDGIHLNASGADLIAKELLIKLKG